MNLDLSGQIALVTGASRGIGQAIADELVKCGAKVIGTATTSEGAKAIDARLKPTGGAGLVLNVTAPNACEEIIDQIVKEYGGIHILVNNAGLALGLDKFQDYDLTDMMTMIDTNIKGLLTVTRQLLPQMVENNEGHIINIGSTAGIYAYAGAAVYAATKSAVKVLSDGIRIDTIDKNIKVTTLQPGIVETDFSQVRFHGDKERAATVYQGIDALQASDIAQCTLFVANQPAHVQISDMTIMATKQATGFTIHRE